MITRDEILRLLAPHGRPCVSLFLPTHRHAPDSAQDPIRFRNLLKSARTLLAEGTPKAVAEEVLKPIEALADPAFWRDQLDGLAVFACPGFHAVYRLPLPLPERAIVAGSFHVRPIVGALKANRRFYVLSFSQKSVALYEGSPTGLGAIDLRDLPSSMRDALGVPEGGAGLQAHSVGGGDAVYHGGGAPDENRKEELARFFRTIDKALWERLRDERVPLVLAGPASHFPIYREISRYAYLAPEGVEGNVDSATTEELHARAWPVVRAVFDAEEDEAIAEYARLVSSRLATSILTEVSSAAVKGRVRRLFVQQGKILFGHLDPATGDVLLHGRQEGAADDDVLDDLTEAVLARAGDVLELPAGKMPEGAAAAAILRW
jgi:hypothetical protein